MGVFETEFIDFIKHLFQLCWDSLFLFFCLDSIFIPLRNFWVNGYSSKSWRIPLFLFSNILRAISVLKFSLKFNILVNLFEFYFLSGMNGSFTPSEKSIGDIFNFVLKGFNFKQNTCIFNWFIKVHSTLQDWWLIFFSFSWFWK